MLKVRCHRRRLSKENLWILRSAATSYPIVYPIPSPCRTGLSVAVYFNPHFLMFCCGNCSAAAWQGRQASSRAGAAAGACCCCCCMQRPSRNNNTMSSAEGGGGGVGPAFVLPSWWAPNKTPRRVKLFLTFDNILYVFWSKTLGNFFFLKLLYLCGVWFHL